MAKQVHLVRLKPAQPNKGIRVQRYAYRGVIYTAKAGWYRIEDVQLVRELQKLRQKVHDPDSPPLFDVCTEEQARAIEVREREGVQSVSRATPVRSMVAGERPRPRGALTTADVRPRRPELAKELAEDEEPAVEEVGRLDEPEAEGSEDFSEDQFDEAFGGDADEVGKLDEDPGDSEEVGREAPPPSPVPAAPKARTAAKREPKKAKPKPRARG